MIWPENLYDTNRLGFYALLRSLAILFLVLLPSGGSAEMIISLLHSREIANSSADFTEVSGLSIAAGGGFWSVSDDTARLFRLDEKGKLHEKRSLPAEPGLEGIAEDLSRHRLLAVREDTSEILSVSPDGAVSRFGLLSMKNSQTLAPYFSTGENDGLEGITVNPATGAVFVLKERKPRLIIELAPDLTRVVRILRLTPSVGFVSAAAEEERLDVSGLAWDARRGGIWITSDTGRAVFFLSLPDMSARGWALMDTRKKRLETVSNAEGIALSPDGNRLYVVTDDGKKSRLLTYRID